jgi:ABC-type Fe3+/spermidine/putrescine transport system ATPase subunit
VSGMNSRAAPNGLDAEFRIPRRHFVVEGRLHLEPGERMAIFGTSGAGKTTILEAIAGETRLESGEIWLDGLLTNGAPRHGRRSQAPAAPRERGVASVRQPTTLFPHLSVRDNVTYGIRRRAAAPSHAHAIDDLLDRVGLGGLARARPLELSGGQRQRVAIARAISRPFRALLLDEPFSAVDIPSRGALREAAIETSEALSAVSVLVTHDLAEAQAFGHTIAVVDGGSILQVDKPAIIARRPSTSRVAELLGYTEFVPAPDGQTWALHPDRYLIGRHDGVGPVFAGVVRAVRPAGTRFVCDLECRLAVQAPGWDSHSSSANRRLQVHVDAEPTVGKQLVVTAKAPPTVTGLSSRGGNGGRPGA